MTTRHHVLPSIFEKKIERDAKFGLDHSAPLDLVDKRKATGKGTEHYHVNFTLLKAGRPFGQVQAGKWVVGLAFTFKQLGYIAQWGTAGREPYPPVVPDGG